MTRCSIALFVCLAAGSASAATPIFRCGQTYSQTPCDGGRQLEVNDGRTAAQRAEAKRVAAREKAVQAERERKARETAEKPPATEEAAASAPAAASAVKVAKKAPERK
ncbi:MAG TPA: hypothetical protein VF169_15905 [Albitalea sp.]|uniref:hypothetical protein n=1 Tax=Piscinibacter sp. TaxID=1903157 RepID=UPI002ED0352C